jgi:sortase B
LQAELRLCLLSDEVLMKQSIKRAVVLFLISVIILGSYQIYSGLAAYRQIETYRADVERKYVVEPSASAGVPSPAPGTETAEATQPPQISAQEPEPEPEPSAEAEKEAAPITVDFDALLQDCPDTVGWLYTLDGTVNLPVVQGTDNLYYLTHTADGREVSGGSLFLDYLNESDFSEDVSFIYGHNMKNGSMFEPLLSYRKQSYYDSYPVIYLLTPTQDYKLELFSGFVTTMESDVYTFNFDTEEAKKQYISEMAALSEFTPRSLPDATDRIVCLSTCAYDFENARYVLLGRLVEVG